MLSIYDLSAEQRLNQFYYQAHRYAFLMLDLDGNVIDWSPGAEQLTGWRAAQMQGKPVDIIYTEEDRAAGILEIELNTARRIGDASDIRWHVRRDGSYFFADGVLSAIRDSNGEIIGFGKILRDVTARKEQSDYLWKQASLLDLAYDAAICWNFYSDCIVYWNKGAEEIYGFTAEEALGKSPNALLATVYPVNIEAAKDSLRRTGRWQGELVHTTKNGKQIRVESRMTLRSDLGNEPVVLETNRDETAQKQAVADLKASERRFRSLVSATAKIVMQLEPDGSVSIDSESWRMFTGQSYDELRGFGWLDAIHPDDRSKAFPAWAKATRSRKYRESIYRIRNAQGEYRWTQIHGAPILNDDGSIREWIKAFTDITDIRKAEERIRESTERTILATSSAKLGIWVWHVQEDEVIWENDRVYEIIGVPKTAGPVNATQFFSECVYPDDEPVVKRALNSTLETGARLEAQVRIHRLSDHALRWIEISGMLHYNEDGSPFRIVGTLADITERKDAEERLHESKQALELAIEATGLGLFDYLPKTGELYWSPETKRHFGLSSSATVNYDVFLQALHPEDRERVRIASEKMLKGPRAGSRYHVTYRTIGIQDGKMRWIDSWGRVILDESGQAVRAIGTTLDVTSKKRDEERIRQMALRDPLTGLSNRRLLFIYAEHVFARAQRSGKNSGILFVDLDRFKPINDNYGHEVGDEVLREVSRRLIQCVRTEDFVFRLGGDEFLVLLPEITDARNAGEVARHMCNCLSQPYHVGLFELSLSASVGISIFPQDGKDIDTLMNHADSAMYLAKQEGRNTVQFYSQGLAERSEIQFMIEERIKKTFSQNAFKLYYQPVVDTTNARLIGVEALLRWPYEEVGPDRFVPIAESTGQINRLGDWVISEACRQHIAWRDRGMPTIPISINVSTVQFRQKEFASRFARILSDYNIDISALQMEVTETALMENVDHAIDVLAQLRNLGIKLALDDFGTGYSSLNYLSRLPIDKIKVDKTFVQRIESDTVSRAITEAVIALGRTLDLEVVAEGIESGEVFHYLRRHGCTQAQGFYVCKPLSAEGFETWYQEYCESLAF